MLTARLRGQGHHCIGDRMKPNSLCSPGTSLMTAVQASLTHDQAAQAKAPGTSCPRTTKKPLRADCNFRQRDHHYTALPVSTVLKVRMRDLEVTNSDLQRVMGYDRPNVVAMMRTGSMRLPVTKVAEVAKKLHVDPVFLLGKVLAENDAALWGVIASIMGDRLITANEMTLIASMRTVLDGHDVDLTEVPEFMQVVTASLAAIVSRQNALTKAAMVAIAVADKGSGRGPSQCENS